MISALFELIFVLIRLYFWAIILAAVFSMLTAFGVPRRGPRAWNDHGCGPLVFGRA